MTVCRSSGQPISAVVPLPVGLQTGGGGAPTARLWLTTPRGSTDAIFDTLSQVCDRHCWAQAFDNAYSPIYPQSCIFSLHVHIMCISSRLFTCAMPVRPWFGQLPKLAMACNSECSAHDVRCVSFQNQFAYVCSGSQYAFTALVTWLLGCASPEICTMPLYNITQQDDASCNDICTLAFRAGPSYAWQTRNSCDVLLTSLQYLVCLAAGSAGCCGSSCSSNVPAG